MINLQQKQSLQEEKEKSAFLLESGSETLETLEH